MNGITVSHIRNGNFIDVYLVFGEGKRNSDSFITSKEIDAKIKQNKPATGKVGHIRVKFDPSTKVLRFVTYYPFGNKGSTLNPHKRFLLQTGVGARAERLLLKRAQREFGEILYIRQSQPLHDRIEQLKKRWHTEEEARSKIPFGEYSRAIREKIGMSIRRR